MSNDIERAAVSGTATPVARDRSAFAAWGDLVGAVTVGAGLILIAISAYLAAADGKVDSKPDLASELRYLVPGGAGGVALVVFGTGLLLLHAMRRTRDRVEAAQLALADELERLQQAQGTDAAGPLVVVGGAAYHLPVCRLVDVSARSEFITPADAVARGLAACELCRPAGHAAPARGLELGASA